MWDIAEIFKSSQSEEEVEGEQALMYLARRYKGLTVNACAHAIFCRLLQALSHIQRSAQEVKTSRHQHHPLLNGWWGSVSWKGRTACSLGVPLGWCQFPCFPRPSKTEKCLPTSLVDNCSLKVGIIGGGHLGKQLAQALLTLSWAPCCSIRISTRRPESLDLQEQGIGCFYDNAQLVAWADVVFLCCLPLHVLTVCSVVRPAIRKPCVVYSLVTAVPLRRLKQLLSYSAIMRPQYQCSGREPINEWGMKGTVTAALQDTAVVQATCPCSSQGKIRVNAKWLVAIFYAALNSSMWQSLPHQKALKLLNDLCFPEHCPFCAEQKTSCPLFVCESFVSKTFASSMNQEETFPWFDLTAAQLRESPFSQLLENSESVWSHLALLYQKSFGDWPTEQHGLISTNTSLTSAVVEPGAMLDRKSSFSTTASEISSEILEETTDYDSKSS
ncbi:NADP-dependent oxidoreductase domain-containing protein 1 [Apteryx rowi]|uniref:NADP-dependent oxidoreductase domain-containing protein 1 n=1 Tax=Apteryx rowi TaxID=308060 RepID=UPI000E1DF2D2|nr:NADP-dependent oxidoreductase domain-containing protein 1 [Apteryx rowi]